MKRLYLLISCLLATATATAQWGSVDEPQWVVPLGTGIYSNEMAVGPGGTVWYLMLHHYMDKDSVVHYDYRLQCFDKEGRKPFGDMGVFVCGERNRSYTVCNQLLYVDRDDNAIVVAHDSRNSSAEDQLMSYTAYKVSPEGKMEWGEDGVAIDGGKAYSMSAGMSITQIDDGSYVFAWMRPIADNAFAIEMQRVSAAGKLLWNADDVRLFDSSNSMVYPYLVNTGNNQVILVYAKGGNQDLYARKLDFDGTSAWAKDTRIYRGGWGSIPLWTILTVRPSGDGGVLVGWNDDRAYTNVESAYISYVTTDGKLGFAGASDEGDVKVGYSGYRGFNCRVMPSPDGDGFFALWRETDGAQNYQRVMMQRISRTGELVWGDDGVAICDMDTYACGYLSMQPGAEGEVAAFYMRRGDNIGFGNVDAYVHAVNATTGHDAWADGSVRLVESIEERSSLKSAVSASDQCWYAAWNANGFFGEGRREGYQIQRLSFDGEFCAALSDIRAVADARASFAYDGTAFSVAGGTTPIDIYDIAGCRVATLPAAAGRVAWTADAPGLYVARRGGEAIKLLAQ